MNKYKRGWFGNSHGHSLAAKGIRLYARKQSHVDPLFYAVKMETQIPTSHFLDMAKKKLFFGDVKDMHPDADAEMLRRRMIKAIDSREGTDTMSMLDSNGVDESVSMARSNSLLNARMQGSLNDPMKSSYIPDVKVRLLQSRLRGVNDASK